jgi:hypothetical protein
MAQHRLHLHTSMLTTDFSERRVGASPECWRLVALLAASRLDELPSVSLRFNSSYEFFNDATQSRIEKRQAADLKKSK